VAVTVGGGSCNDEKDDVADLRKVGRDRNVKKLEPLTLALGGGNDLSERYEEYEEYESEWLFPCDDDHD
jgi:hypothetical protein